MTVDFEKLFRKLASHRTVFKKRRGVKPPKPRERKASVDEVKQAWKLEVRK